MKKDKRVRCVKCKKKKEKSEYTKGKVSGKLCDKCVVIRDREKKNYKENNPHLAPSKIRKIEYNGCEFSVISRKREKSKSRKTSQLYLIKCYKGSEEFLKLGLTTKSVKDRYKLNMPYKYKVIATMSVKLDALLDYEKAIHSLFLKHRYSPIIKFNGHTECYNSSAEKDIAKFFV